MNVQQTNEGHTTRRRGACTDLLEEACSTIYAMPWRNLVC